MKYFIITTFLGLSSSLFAQEKAVRMGKGKTFKLKRTTSLPTDIAKFADGEDSIVTHQETAQGKVKIVVKRPTSFANWTMPDYCGHFCTSKDITLNEEVAGGNEAFIVTIEDEVSGEVFEEELVTKCTLFGNLTGPLSFDYSTGYGNIYGKEKTYLRYHITCKSKFLPEDDAIAFFISVAVNNQNQATTTKITTDLKSNMFESKS